MPRPSVWAAASTSWSLWTKRPFPSPGKCGGGLSRSPAISTGLSPLELSGRIGRSGEIFISQRRIFPHRFDGEGRTGGIRGGHSPVLREGQRPFLGPAFGWGHSPLYKERVEKMGRIQCRLRGIIRYGKQGRRSRLKTGQSLLFKERQKSIRNFPCIKKGKEGPHSERRFSVLLY